MKKKILLLLFFIFQISLFHYIFALAESPKNYLKGKFYSSVKDHFLIATEKMRDNRFNETVIIMLESDENGAWGLVINKRIGTMPIALLIDPSLNTSEEREKLYGVNIPVFWGGPVDAKEIFILHTVEYQSDTTKNYGDISISQDYNILLDIAKNRGPEKSLVILGYSGWGSGQLEGEMERDSWVLSEINKDLIFKIDNDKVKVKIDDLLNLEPLDFYIHHLFIDYDFNFKEIIKIFNSDSGKFIISKTHRLTKNKNFLIITRND